MIRAADLVLEATEVHDPVGRQVTITHKPTGKHATGYGRSDLEARAEAMERLRQQLPHYPSWEDETTPYLDALAELRAVLGDEIGRVIRAGSAGAAVVPHPNLAAAWEAVVSKGSLYRGDLQ